MACFLSIMPQSHYAPVHPRMIPYDKLNCTGMYVNVREDYWSNTWAIRDLYMALRNSLLTGEGFLNCSKNKPVQIVRELYWNHVGNICDHCNYVPFTSSIYPVHFPSPSCNYASRNHQHWNFTESVREPTWSMHNAEVTLSSRTSPYDPVWQIVMYGNVRERTEGLLVKYLSCMRVIRGLT